ncbi:MAG: hypothetical protein IJZ78_03445 [Alistipes sp.]|nr:hypothetical protein [Alistipes sp.]MBQ8204854.1 hypothetical protein [Alistipes sp.]
MNVDIIIMVVVTLLLAMLGVAIIFGRADWAIKQYRRNSERYNLLRLRVVTGAVLIIIALIIPFMVIFESCHNILAGVIVGVAIIFGILQETWARRR